MQSQFSLFQPSTDGLEIKTVVAMAVYSQDRLSWLLNAVESVLNQSYTDFVFVIVIDGDVSNAILAFLKELSRNESRVIVIISES
ncbi:glycosyltransferase, partial [Paraglaciecola sp.]|uniref:glycosyltransferase n=1 Tax=Paraglaciecola sp. TaxID=1920173 RepID=UPI00273EDC08